MTAMAKPAKKIGLVDRYAIGLGLEVAAVAVDPDEYSYRAVFREVMPKLYVMRKRGMSFPQIHRLLNQTGFPVALATVRTYYSQCLPGMLDECQKYLRKLDQVIEGGQKSTDVDRTEKLRAAKGAMRSAAATEAEKRAAAAINTFAGANAPEALISPSFTPPEANVVATTLIPSHKSPLVSGAPQPPAATGVPGSAHCLTKPSETQIEISGDLPPEVLSDAVLEHPAISGLLLTRSQRLFVGRLEYINVAGTQCLEKGTEMMNRKEWKAAVPTSVGRTSGDFVELDATIIGRRRKS
ncbi:hypothetical protein [Paraburkholderia sp.]|uniref:hypothetical protein n=1 Tax=Paraburkholderia sp. TaxID=1926495 RepID=UPI002397B836|nr:hypothetical protein [Paraburkholderia sp.]MDE1181489.1 hypothetical protein [Paraburkholderia sp.]